MRFTTFVCSLALSMMVGCNAQPEIDLEAERSSLISADQAWYEAYSASDDPADAFIARVLDDATLLPPDNPLARGKEAIRAVIAGLEAMPGFSVTWRAEVADVGSGGDLGFTRGSYQMRMESPEGPITIDGKYLTIWKRQPDGTWMVAADMFNANGPPTSQS